MELTYLVTLVALVYILFRMSKRMQLLQERSDYLIKQLAEMRQLLSRAPASPQLPEKQAPPQARPETSASPQERTQPLAQQQPPVMAAPALPPPPAGTPPQPLPAAEVSQAAFRPPVDRGDRRPLPRPAGQVAPQQPGLVARFLKNNPDLEKFIGENLINKIGIAILVLGIGYFVKYAIDQNWINEIGRVFIGILAGGALMGLAHWLHRRLPAFSSVLVGGGLAVLYFTIAIAFQEYRLFSQASAFVLMVVITGFSILLSVTYNRVELAVLSLLGGFATPLMLNTGSGNYQVLFTYILILNMGMLVLAYLKDWKILNWIAYAFTLILYGGWLSTRVLGLAQAPLVGALVFGTLYYLVFFAMNIVNNLKERRPFGAADISILLSNTFLYYASGMLVLDQIRQGFYQGLFTVVLAVFNFVFAYGLLRSRRADRNLVYLLLGLVVTFASLAVPVQLEGNYITMFWALEAVLLLWLYLKSDLKMLFLSATAVLALMTGSLVMDWTQLYLPDPGLAPLPVLVNKAFITSCISLAALGAVIGLLGRASGPLSFRYFRFELPRYRLLLGGLLAVLLYLALALELHYQLNRYVALASNRSILTGAYNLAFLLGLLVFARRKNRPRLSHIATLLGMAGVLAYVLLFSPAVLTLLQGHFLEGQPELIGFPFHYLSLVLVAALLAMIYQNVGRQRLPAGISRIWTWTLGAVAVYIASAELLFHVVYLNFPLLEAGGDAGQRASEHLASLMRQTNKVGFPILWGLCAFALMLSGLRRKNKNLRIMALTLFTLTLLKLFLYDIRGISEGGKIAAFISLGVLLLVISFMYQNLKRLILTDETAPPAED
ncbi:MAG: DUF2339 domain-containing protein [Adhaeribacter sp.]